MRGFVLAAALVGITLFPAAAGATHSSGGGPNKDLVAGTGKVAFGQFHVNADSLPSEENLYGRLSTSVVSADFRGRTTCVRAHGNQATVGGRVTESNNPLVPPGSGVIGFFEDNGESNRNDPPDRFTGNFVAQPPPPGLCPPPEPFALDASPVLQGDFIVHDGGLF